MLIFRKAWRDSKNAAFSSNKVERNHSTREVIFIIGAESERRGIRKQIWLQPTPSGAICLTAGYKIVYEEQSQQN